MNTVIENDVTFMCTSCGKLAKGKVSLEISSELDVSSIDVQLQTECEKCHSVCVEVQDEISEALSILQSKRYGIVKSEQGEYCSDVFAPYVIINTNGAKITPPEGWNLAFGYDPCSPHVMIVPDGSFGLLDKREAASQLQNYQTDKMFTFHQFDKKRKKYIAQLKAWAESLPFNSTIAVPTEAAKDIEKSIVDEA